MPSRRSLLAALGVGGVAALTVPRVFARPVFEPETGVGFLHPADQQVLAEGVGSDGESRASATVAADRAPSLIGPDAPAPIRDELDGDGGDVFHVVVQYRCRSEQPVVLTVDGARRPFLGPLTVEVRVEPWGSLADVDDPDTRQRLQSASALHYTAVWSLGPAPDRLPDRVEARYSHSASQRL